MPDPNTTAPDGALPVAERPRVYVACLAAYNSGILHGRWIAVTTPEEVKAEVGAMLGESPVPRAQEWAIHDYEGYEGVCLSEHATFETVCELADFVEEHGRLAAKLYSHFGNGLTEARAAFENYAGQYQTAGAFAEEMIRETGTEIPASLEYYIDWQALARDMALNGEILVIQTSFDEVHVFWCR